MMPPRASALYEYPDGSVAEVFKTPSDRFSMSELAEHISRDPDAMDAGCVYVQTAETVSGQSEPVRRRYYFDNQAVSDPQKNQATYLDTVHLADSAYDLVIGSKWLSPLGEAQGIVEVVSVPWTRGYDSTKTAKRQGPSPMVKGRQTLDLIEAQRHTVQNRSTNPAVARALTNIATGLRDFTTGK